MRKILAPLFVSSLLTLSQTAAAADDSIAGDYFETCSCDPVCPCIFHSDPTQGFCKGSLVWHINKGTHGEAQLDGLNVVIALDVNGNMRSQAGKWGGVLYIDAKATPEQRTALSELFTSRFGSRFGHLAGPKPVEMTYVQNENRRSMNIPDVLKADIEAMVDGQGQAPRITNPPTSITGFPLLVAKSIAHEYSDEDLDTWNYTGRSAFISEFKYVLDTNENP